jgi:hypothetical protein
MMGEETKHAPMNPTIKKPLQKTSSPQSVAAVRRPPIYI